MKKSLTILAVYLLTNGTSVWAALQTFERSSAWDVEGIRVYHLKGTAEEIGQAAAALGRKDASTRSVVPYIANYTEKLISGLKFFRDNPDFRKLIPVYLFLEYYKPLSENIPPTYKLQLDAYAEGLKINQNHMRKGFLNADIVPILVSRHLNDEFKDIPKTHSCSSFVALPSITGGETFFGRLMDYAAAKRFSSQPAVYFIERETFPHREKKLKYAIVSTEGVLIGGTTAMNESGLSIALHNAFSKKNNMDGVPILAVATKIMEEARSIEDAVKICHEHMPLTGWFMHLADTATGKPRAAVIEINPGRRSCDVKFSEEYSVLTNHYQNPENIVDEIRLGHSIDEATRSRLARLKKLIEKFRGSLNLNQVTSILSDRYDLESNRVHPATPNAIAVMSQATSVIFAPESRRFWVSNGVRIPSTSGSYVSFRFDDLSHDSDLDIKVNDDENSLWPGFSEYLSAYDLTDEAVSPNDDVWKKSLFYLDRAIELEASEPIYRLIRGLILFRLQRFEKSLSDLIGLELSDGLDHHRRSVALLYVARIFDLLGKREEALRAYESIIKMDTVSIDVLQVAQEGVKKKYLKTDSRFIQPDLRYLDTFGY